MFSNELYSNERVVAFLSLWGLVFVSELGGEDTFRQTLASLWV